MIKPPAYVILSAMQQKDYKIASKPYEINIIGIRKHLGKINTFDDLICILYKDNDSYWNCLYFNATVDPGSYYMQHLLNKNGTAILLEGQYPYKVGMHKNYQALVQDGNVTVIRDSNLDNIHDFNGRIFKGRFGINIHRASLWGVLEKIGKYSAGCQVVQDPKNFELLMMYAINHTIKYGNHINYTLLNELDLYRFGEIKPKPLEFIKVV